MFVFQFLINFFLVTATISSKFEGDRCIHKSDGKSGTCTRIDKCPQAWNILSRNRGPQNCGFVGIIPIVCCPTPRRDFISVVIPTSTPIPIQKISTTRQVTNNVIATTPLTTVFTTTLTGLLGGSQEFNVTGKRAERKCFEYQSRRIFGGTFAEAKEFPHMAIVGYGNDEKNIQWACGGSLISTSHVLTAAHCAASRDLGPVKWVRLGDLDIKNNTDDARPQNFNVTEVFVHPEYNSASHYHDIAVLKLGDKAKFNEYVKAACLHLVKEIPANKTLLATGWGKVDFAGESSSHLLKVVLFYVKNSECAKSYVRVSAKKLSQGIVDEWQMCAGHPDGGDTCPGDSGGPLQYPDLPDYERLLKKNGKVLTFYYIVGVTSFGKACGVAGSPGVYTRVSNYVRWIEDIAWPLSDFNSYVH